MVPATQNEGSDRAPDEKGARSTPIPDSSAVPEEVLRPQADVDVEFAEIAATFPEAFLSLPKVLEYGGIMPFAFTEDVPTVAKEQPGQEPAVDLRPSALTPPWASKGKLIAVALGGALLTPLAAAVVIAYRSRQVAQIRTA
ncbi:hypothetical protein [Kribbella ginsengisoli]|uniref:Uncharacterized protein n=1 Tax=Kribbella ginsengisoli TaxID=363865 RepID=A0ABP6XNN5_9ACTN